VDLVSDDADAVPIGEGGDVAKFVDGVHGAGGVVRVAQQVGGAAPFAACPSERVVEHIEVQAAVCGERRLADLPLGVDREGIERRVHRRIHNDRVAGLGDEPQYLDDAQHDVRHERRPLDRQLAPVPAPGGETGERLGVPGAVRVARVSRLRRCADRFDNRYGQVDVHLGYPQRQHSGGWARHLTLVR
jgi:hypothetical protein